MIAAQASTYTDLHNFSGWSVSPYNFSPNGGVTLYGGDLFGANSVGGAHSHGFVWEYASGTYTDLYDFGGTGSNDGQSPCAAVVFDSSGNMYGTCPSGDGTSANGTLWEIAPSGSTYSVSSGATYSAVHVFGSLLYTGQYDGASPSPGVVIDSSGNMWGATTDGGGTSSLTGSGVIWEIPSGGSYGLVHVFGGTVTNAGGTSGADGTGPFAQVSLDSSGDLWGTCGAGGPSSGGVTWEWTTTSAYVDRHDFTSNTNAADPLSPIVFDGSGNAYGTTYGSSGGVLYEIGSYASYSYGGTYSTLHTFPANNNDGGYPWNSLVYSGGNIYGTTQRDGGQGGGCIWKCSTGGTESVSFVFYYYDLGTTHGWWPDGQLTVDGSGNIYGETEFGGPGTSMMMGNPGDGVIWKFTP